MLFFPHLLHRIIRLSKLLIILQINYLDLEKFEKGGRYDVSQQVIDMRCPGCGAPTSTGETTCKYCYRPVVITTFNSVYNMSIPEVNKYAGAYRSSLALHPDNIALNNSIAMCYLKLKFYDQAYEAFKKAIEQNFDNSETYFYAAICLLRGKKAFLASRSDIDKIEEYIKAALMIEPKGIYYYFWAYIKQDHFARKSYKTSPTYQEALKMAVQAGLSEYDVKLLYEILGVQRPNCL